MDMNEFARTYFNFCNEVGLRPAQVIVSAGGALLMLGLRERCEDLDLDVPASTYALQRYRLGAEKERVTKHGTFLDYNEKVSLQRLPTGITVQTVNGIWLYSLDDLIRQKEALIQSLDRTPLKVKQDLIDILRLRRDVVIGLSRCWNTRKTDNPIQR